VQSRRRLSKSPLQLEEEIPAAFLRRTKFRCTKIRYIITGNQRKWEKLPKILDTGTGIGEGLTTTCGFVRQKG
jgi:hypothetical protein